MQGITANKLFWEVSIEDSATVSGGQNNTNGQTNTFDLDRYLFVLGAGVVFGNPGLTPEEIQFGWESALTNRNNTDVSV